MRAPPNPRSAAAERRRNGDGSIAQAAMNTQYATAPINIEGRGPNFRSRDGAINDTTLNTKYKIAKLINPKSDAIVVT